MIESEATVIETEGDYVWVAAAAKSSCGSCSVKSGCGVSALDSVFGRRVNHVRAFNPIQAGPGDRVIVGIHESTLLKSMGWLYFVPLMGLVLGAAFASLLHTHDLVSVLGGVLGFGVGSLAARRAVGGLESDESQRPRLIRIAGPATQVTVSADFVR